VTAEQYLSGLLARESVDISGSSGVLQVQAAIAPTIQKWAGNQLLNIAPSGSFAKGTAVRSGTDIDLFISLSETTTSTLKEIYESLFSTLGSVGLLPKRQNVSINVHINGYDVDLVPAKRQTPMSLDHSLYRRRADSWTKTNIATHVNHVRAANKLQESRVLKLWRNQKSIDFPSFYLELSVIAALFNQYGSVSENVWKVFQYLSTNFVSARIVDPANSNNVISDDLTVAEKEKVRQAAVKALSASTWQEIVK
jgi:hypothetical protein